MFHHVGAAGVSLIFMKYVKVEKKKANNTIKKLVKLGAYSKGHRAFCEGNFVFVPIAKIPTGKWQIVELEKEEKQKPRDLKSVLTSKIGPEAASKLFSSFDIIGDIAIIEVPKGMEKYEKELAESIREVHPNVKVVAKKASAISGDYRVRQVKVIIGGNRTETLYKEHGCKMLLDVAKVYFSVRLSHERRRIAEQVKPNERILALFAGVGPFPLVIAKKQPKSEIVAIELNPDAVRYMRENVELNKVKNIIVEEGDARKIVLEKYKNFADRILMPLPRSADEFLDVAFAGARDGCIAHIYHFAPIEDPYRDIEEKIAQEAKKANAKVKIINKRIVRPFAPKIVQVVVDFKIKFNL